MPQNIMVDAHYLLKAIDEGIKGLQQNGLDYGSQVGCILVNNVGEIIGQAHNDLFFGIRKHAEEIVLSDLVEVNLSGATLYLTIEPCNGNPFHERKHCCEQIVEAGISRVVLGSLKAIYQGGADYLMKQGVEVDILENDRCSLLTANGKQGGRINPRTYKRIMAIRNEISI
jgi:pyrimidine deaminase RibD-like protein